VNSEKEVEEQRKWLEAAIDRMEGDTTKAP
jgi:hypothetical protein